MYTDIDHKLFEDWCELLPVFLIDPDELFESKFGVNSLFLKVSHHFVNKIQSSCSKRVFLISQ